MTAGSKALIAGLPTGPGVYRLLDAGKQVLYVGKARNLKKRVQSYFRPNLLNPRIAALVRQVKDVEVTRTHTEGEALLLENNLIKSLHPRFNVVLRDDKSYPYIYVSTGDMFPRFAFYRGARREPGRFFGPYPSAYSVRQTLNQLQKIFRVRQCEDGFFRNRSRPCLQHQIARCTAPCVGLINREEYAADVRHALMFLEGQTQQAIEELAARMETASARHDYELAALYRDRIAALRRVEEHQYISTEGGDADVVAIAQNREQFCVEIMFIRGGHNLGSKAFFPSASVETSAGEILAAFLPQYYLGKAIPAQIYVELKLPDQALLERVFSEQSERSVRLHRPQRGPARHWIEMARMNAEEGLRRAAGSRLDGSARLEALREALALEANPERIECFDVSHTFGEATVASCVVFDANGPVKSDYRRFNIEGVTPGDDYGALKQALERRYRRVKEGEGRLPDLLFIDGGKGQVGAARAVLDELQLDGVVLVGIAKGRERKPGKEQLFLSGHRAPTILPADSPALHLIQQIRDEAHRFAITAHRMRRGKARTTSALESIPGIGSRRRQALLRNFGGLRGVARAGVEDLAKVPGISRDLAQRIYDLFHDQKTDRRA